jgi:hypothetical protein
LGVWRCEDCHKIGFYFGISSEEMDKKHRIECMKITEPVPTETVSLSEGDLHLNLSNKDIKGELL